MNTTGVKQLRLEQAEMVCRMAEAFLQCPRPDGLTADQAVAIMPESERDGWLRASEAMRDYVNEQLAQAMVTPYPAMPEHLH